jgi:hypothetical protein
MAAGGAGAGRCLRYWYVHRQAASFPATCCVFIHHHLVGRATRKEVVAIFTIRIVYRKSKSKSKTRGSDDVEYTPANPTETLGAGQ